MKCRQCFACSWKTHGIKVDDAVAKEILDAAKHGDLIMTTPKTLQAVLLCIGIGCSQESQTIEAPILEQGLREYLDERKEEDATSIPKVFTDEELETMTSHKPREVIGMNFYYDELQKRNDAKWAKEELDRRKAIRCNAPHNGA